MKAKQTAKVKGHISIHRKQGQAFGPSLAGSKEYEFEVESGPQGPDWTMAEESLRELWKRDGCLVRGEKFDANDPALTTYPNLEEI